MGILAGVLRPWKYSNLKGLITWLAFPVAGGECRTPQNAPWWIVATMGEWFGIRLPSAVAAMPVHSEQDDISDVQWKATGSGK